MPYDINYFDTSKYRVTGQYPTSDTGWVSDGSKLVFHGYETKSSVKTPNYRRRAKTRLPINPYSYTLDQMYDYMQTTGRWSRNVASGQILVHDALANYNYYNGGHPSLTLIAADPYNIAVSKVLKKLNTASANSLVTLAEGGKTAKSITDTATRIYKSIKALRNLRFREFAKELGFKPTTKQVRAFYQKAEKIRFDDFYETRKKYPGLSYKKFKRNYSRFSMDTHSNVPLGSLKDVVGNTWLEYSYAWKPLLADIDDHAKALAKQVVEHSNVVRRVTAAAETSLERVTLVATTQDRFNYQTYKCKRSTKIGVFYTVPSTINPINNFGLNNPLVVAWELVPFSFVVDWFLPIGDALQSLSATSGLTFHSGYVNARYTQDIQCELIPKAQYVLSGWSYAPYGVLRYKRKLFGISRNILNTFPTPVMPQFKDPRSWQHAASAISLLNSLFLRK